MTYRNISKTITQRYHGTYKTDCRPQTYNNVTQYEKNYASGTNSPIVKGHLQFRQNTYSCDKRRFNLSKPLRLTKEYSCGTAAVYATESLWPGMPSDYMNFTGVSYLGSSSSNLQIATASKFYSQLAELKLNAAEMFVTRQKTVDMIASSASRIAGLYLSLRRGRNPFTGTSCNGANAAKYWLEYVYGWVPLVQDVYEGLNLQKLDPPPFRYRVSKKEKIDNSISIKGNISGITAGETSFTAYGSRVCTIRADVVVSDPSVAFAKALGLTNPALLTWELLPYSFVVDWFLPIGPWLESTQALSGLTLTNPSTTNGIVVFVDILSSAVDSSATGWNGDGSGKAMNIRISRDKTIPSLPLPRLKSPVSVTHALNALALLVSAFKR